MGGYTRKIVLVAVFAAMLTAGKFVLSWIPNVEIVTLFLTVFAVIFGISFALPAALIFSATEILLYGVGYWVLSYFIHWTAVVLVAGFLGRKGVRSEYVYALAAAVATFLFGLQSAVVDLALSGGFSHFGARFLTYYASGAIFYIVHVASNYVIVLLLFAPLSRAALRMKSAYFGSPIENASK